MEWFLKEWAGLIITAVFGALVTALSRIFKRQKAVEDGLVALLHSEIRREYKECEAKEYASIPDLENVENLYKSYHALGGNGTGTELVERIRNMPTSPPDMKGELVS